LPRPLDVSCRLSTLSPGTATPCCRFAARWLASPFTRFRRRASLLSPKSVDEVPLAVDGVVTQFRPVLFDEHRVVCLPNFVSIDVFFLAFEGTAEVRGVAPGRISQVAHVCRLSLGSNCNPGVDESLFLREFRFEVVDISVSHGGPSTAQRFVIRCIG
jgi:hypothetical protein